MKKSLGMFAAAALAACSSGTGTNGVQPPAVQTVNYGTATPVASGSAQQTAANDASTATNNIVVASTSSSAASASFSRRSA